MYKNNYQMRNKKKLLIEQLDHKLDKFKDSGMVLVPQKGWINTIRAFLIGLKSFIPKFKTKDFPSILHISVNNLVFKSKSVFLFGLRSFFLIA